MREYINHGIRGYNLLPLDFILIHGNFNCRSHDHFDRKVEIRCDPLRSGIKWDSSDTDPFDFL